MTDVDGAAATGTGLHARLTGIQLPLTAPIEREIQRQVCEYAEQLKSRGWPPERIIVALKRAASEAGIYSTSRSLATPHDLDAVDQLLTDMVGWCIAQYYSASE